MIAVSVLAMTLPLSGCGKKADTPVEEKQEQTKNEETPEAEKPVPSENAPSNIGVTFDKGKNAGFVIDLPDGYVYDSGWFNWKSPDGKIAIWVNDGTLIDSEDGYKNLLEMAKGEQKKLKVGPYEAIAVERKADDGGLSVDYYVKFKKKIKDFYGYHVQVTTTEKSYEDMESKAILYSIGSVREMGGAADKEKLLKSLHFDFKPEDSVKMSNFISGYGSYALEENTFYGQMYKDGKAVLARFDVEEDGDFAKPVNIKVLDQESGVGDVTIRGDHVYYIRNNNGIYRVKKDGGQPEEVVPGAEDYLQFVGDEMYFVQDGYRLKKASPDGKEITTVIDREIYCPYFLDKDWLIYQDDADNECLHLRHIPTKLDVKLTQQKADCPILRGGYLYAVFGDEGEYKIARIDINHPKMTADKVEFPTEVSNRRSYALFSINYAGMIYSGTGTGYDIKDWKNLENKDGTLKEEYRYVGEKYQISYVYDSDNQLKDIMLARTDTGGGQALPDVK